MLYWKNIDQEKRKKEKEMTVLSEKGKKITIKSEIATCLKEPFKEQPNRNDRWKLPKGNLK